jgi:hypothetical protein
MKTIVISQPMFFPWVGLFEQIRLADVFVHFDDVQLPQGRSFTNRVQIKTKDGSKWLTVPLRKNSPGPNINETHISYDTDWRNDHLKFLESNYARAAFKNDMLSLVDQVYKQKFETIADLDIAGLESICTYYEVLQRPMYRSSALNLQTRKSQLLLDIIKHYEADRYVTGWGALNYLDYNLFESHGVEVEYMDYNKTPYRQSFGDFNPYVSILDLIANEGKEGANFINSLSKPWKTFINERTGTI